MSAETVLVTGATGFVGSHVVDRLLEIGSRVRVIVRPTSDLRWLEGKRIERVDADLRDPVQLRRAVHGTRAVLHFGGKIRVSATEEFFAANADGTGSLGEAFAAEGPQDGSGVFVYCSSLAAGGPAQESDRQPLPHVREDDPPRPIGPYGKSKLEGELRLRRIERQARTVILRPPAIYGPRDESTLRFFRWLEKGWLVLPRSKETRFSLIHVADLVDATILALNDSRARGVYYLSDGTPYSWQDVGGNAAGILGIRYRTIRLPIALAMMGAAIGEIGSRLTRKAPLISLDKVRELREKYWVCFPEKAEREFGFQPRRDLASGLEETIRWYQRAGWLRTTR